MKIVLIIWDIISWR